MERVDPARSRQPSSLNTTPYTRSGSGEGVKGGVSREVMDRARMMLKDKVLNPFKKH